jgi:hypothetical protein
MNVFAKIFAQIFDSSISKDYMVRHVFMDLLVLADRDGVVDMTVDAISRRTNVPEDIVANAIKHLMQPDRSSRSHAEDGARIVLLDSHRDWGWQIVNYDHYRHIRDEESRRAYFRDKKREYRASTRQKGPQSVLDSPTSSTPVTKSPQKSTEGEGDLDLISFVELWNRSTGKLPKVERFTDGRRKKLATRIRQGLTLERFEKAVQCCTTKGFLLGDNDRGWTDTFDWLIDNQENVEKAITNPYSGRKNGSSNGHHPPERTQESLAYEENVKAIMAERKALSK